MVHLVLDVRFSAVSSLAPPVMMNLLVATTAASTVILIRIAGLGYLLSLLVQLYISV